MKVGDKILQLHKRGFSYPQIKKKLKCSGSTIAKYVKGDRSHSETKALKSKRRQGATFFDSIDTEEKAYWLGFLYADGCLLSNKQCYIILTLKTEDRGHLEKFSSLFQIPVKLERRGSQATVRIGNQYIWNSLFEKGLRPRKSLIDITSTFDHVPCELMNHFVRGIFDGDGSVFKQDNRLGIAFYGHRSTCVRIQKILVKTLLVSQLKIHKPDGINCAAIFWKSKKEVNAIYEWMYKNSTIYLKRKYKIFKGSNLC